MNIMNTEISQRTYTELERTSLFTLQIHVDLYSEQEKGDYSDQTVRMRRFAHAVRPLFRRRPSFKLL